MAGIDRATEKSRRVWDKHAAKYDRDMAFWERRVFQGDREWACGQAEGDVLEVAVGTGRNFAHYPEGVRLTGFDLSPAMVELARARAEELGLDVRLDEADATHLPYVAESFDTVVCTFSLCAIPDPHRAVFEMRRVLRPGGKLVLVEHVRSDRLPVFLLQMAVELVTIPWMGEHFAREPHLSVREAGLELERSERHTVGFVHRMLARKPA